MSIITDKLRSVARGILGDMIITHCDVELGADTDCTLFITVRIDQNNPKLFKMIIINYQSDFAALWGTVKNDTDCNPEAEFISPELWESMIDIHNEMVPWLGELKHI